jgi:glycerol uptake facilitator-like aquaporin
MPLLVTLALVVFRPQEFASPVGTFFRYFVAQFFGAFFAGMVNYGIWESNIFEYEMRNNITRGLSGSEATAMAFGEYFPNPAFGFLDVSMGLGNFWIFFFFYFFFFF